MSNKINLLLITLRSDIGGGPFHVDQLIDSLPKNKYNIFIASPNTDPFGSKWQKECNKNYFQMPHRKFDFSILLKLYQFIRIKNILIIHSHGKGAGIYARIIKFYLRKDIYCIHTFHGLHINKKTFGNSALINKYLERTFSSITDCAIFVSNGEQESANKNNIKYKNSYVIYNGLDGPGSYRAKDVYDKFRVLSISRFDYSKNMFYAYNIAKNMKEVDNLEFIWLGDGPEKEIIEKEAKKYEINNIKFLGFVDNVNDYLKNCDILLSTSRGEGMPYSLIEAMSFGLPIIATNVIGHNEMVRNGYNGYLFNTIEEACERLIRLKSNQDQYDKMMRNSFQEFSKKYKKEKMINKLNNIYEVNSNDRS